MRFATDLRHLLFDGTSWYANLTSAAPDHWVLWRISKADESAWWRELLICVAAYARDHDLLPSFRRKIEGIPSNSLSDSSGNREARSAVAPVWEIVNELVVAMYLERALGWRLLQAEPAGYKSRRGDWEFTAPSGRTVFVEVKSLVEPEPTASAVFMRGVAADRLTSVLRGAYRQLPKDGRSTLVVVAGFGPILGIPHGIMFGDLFQTVFGKMQVTFSVLPYVEGSERVGPAFHDMFAHAGKHRRLGCVAGMKIGGTDQPGLGFYAIHNPFAQPDVRLSMEDLPRTRQFWVASSGRGKEYDGLHPADRWKELAVTSKILLE
jgi:hypothetical protein